MAETDSVEELVGFVELVYTRVSSSESRIINGLRAISSGPMYSKTRGLFVRALRNEFGEDVQSEARDLLGRALGKEFGVVGQSCAHDFLVSALRNEFEVAVRSEAFVLLVRALNEDFGGVAQREARVLLEHALKNELGEIAQLSARDLLVRALNHVFGGVAQRQARDLLGRALNERLGVVAQHEACDLSVTISIGAHSPASERVSRLALSLKGPAWEAFCERVASQVAGGQNAVVEWISSVEGKLSDAQREVAVRVAADMFVSWSLPSSTDAALKTRVLKAVHRPLAGLKQGRTAFMQNLVKQTREARVAKPQARAPAR